MTNTISKDAISRGIAFVRTRARPLDVALLDFRIGTGDKAAVLGHLSAFQNKDGGFGHGLDADLPTPASTAIATSIAFRHLCAVAAPANTSLVTRGLAWLKESFDWDAGVWPIITPDVDLTPHAPWWNYTNNLRERNNGFRYNPTAELIGALYCYRDSVTPALLKRAEECLLASLKSSPPDESYDLRCAVRLLEEANAPGPVKAALQEAVVRSVGARDANDPHAPFLDLAPDPRSVVAQAFPEHVQPALSALLAAQRSDGSWRPFWNWSEIDKEAWQKAEREWAGILTRQAVESLMAYDPS